jgi:hypothetical protein
MIASNKMSFTLFLLGIFLLPIDTFPFFPINTAYKPISFFLFFASFLFSLNNRIFYKFDLYVIILAIYIFFHGLIMSYLLFDMYSHLLKSMMTLSVFVMITMLFYNTFKINFEINIDKFIYKITKVFYISFIFISIIGIFQILKIVDIMPNVISDELTLLFTTSVTGNRLQLASGEPGMMSRHLILMFAFIYFFYKGKDKIVISFLFIMFIIFSGSSYAFLSLFLMLISYLVLFNFSKIFNIKFIFIILIMSSIFIISMDHIFEEYTLAKIHNITLILTSFDIDIFLSMVQSDGSMFLRIMNPVIGFLSGKYSYYIGSGIDTYRYIYIDLIKDNFDYALNFGTVIAVMNGETYITPKSLYSRIYAEFGIIFFSVFIIYLALIYRKIRQLKDLSKYYKFLSILFILEIIYPLNVDSIMYMDYIFIVMFVHMLLNKEHARIRGENAFYNI